MSKKDELFEIKKIAGYDDAHRQELDQKRADFLERYPGCENEVEQAIQDGRDFRDAKNLAYRFGNEGRDIEDVLEQISPKLKGKRHIREAYDKGVAARERRLQDQANQGRFDALPPYSQSNLASPISSIRSSVETNVEHPNSLTSLAPSSEWTVLIDETGKIGFDEDSTYVSPYDKRRGKIVAVFIPKEELANFPELPVSWHAVERSLSEIEDVVDRLNNSRCGVLGVSVDALNEVRGNRWFYGISSVLELALRLIETNGATNFKVLLEQRDEIQGDEGTTILKYVLNNVKEDLARAFPEKAKNISFNGSRVIAKDGDRRNGYADAAAFVWGGSTAGSLLKKSRWLHACFIEAPSQTLRDAFDLMRRERRLSLDDWETLVVSSDAEQNNSLVSALLRNLGKDVQTDVKRWKPFLGFVSSRVDSKGIDLQKLRREIQWLNDFAPSRSELSPKLTLIWQVIRLAESNHTGKAVSRESSEYKKLEQAIEKIYAEDARLACLATLNLAVSFTNAYDFKFARALLEWWKGRAPEIPGLNYYGRILSSLGQHDAFEGKYESAIRYFNQAIDGFKKLSDETERRGEIDQTRAYLLTAQMDMEPFPKKEFLENALDYFGATLDETARRLRASDAPEDKYRHSTFVRFLASQDLPETRSAKKIYCENPDEWKTSEGHPWETIEFYRGVFSSNASERLQRFRNAYEIAKNENGATLRVVSAVILGSILPLDPSVAEEYSKSIAEIEREVPKLGDRIAFLKEQPTKKFDPITLAKSVLPFNFR